MVNTANNFQFELSTGVIYTDPACINQVEAGQAPRNLVQLHNLGRLAVYLPESTELSQASDTNKSDVVPLLDLLNGVQQKPAESVTYEHLDVKEWTKNDYTNYGKWLDSLTRDPGRVTSSLSTYVLNRAYNLGIGPGVQHIQRNYFFTLGAYYSAIPIVRSRRQADYNEQLEAARKITQEGGPEEQNEAQKSHALQTLREKTPLIKRELHDGRLPHSVIEGQAGTETFDETVAQVLPRRAKWLLVNELLPELTALEKRMVARQFTANNLMGLIRARSIGSVNDADIKKSAARLGIAEDLWPS